MEKLSEYVPSFVKKTRIYSSLSERRKGSERDTASGLYTISKIMGLRDVFSGCDCFIIGTGPSINDTDMSLLAKKINFGVNTLFKKGLKTDFYVVHDGNMWRYNSTEILKQPSTIFLCESAGCKYLLSGNRQNNVIAIPQCSDDVFSTDLANGIGINASVVIVSLQIAYYLGFSEVYLVGCDSANKGHHFHPIDENAKITLRRKVDTWGRVMRQYELCKAQFEKDGRKIYNSTVGGMLEVFERVPLEEAIKR